MLDLRKITEGKGIRNTLVHFLPVCVISLCGYHAGASSMQAQHDPSMLLRFGNQAPVRKDYCDVNPVVLSLRPPSLYQERCDPAQVMSFGCRGQCRSYVEVDPHNPMQQQRHCRCCKTTRWGVHLASLPCRDGTKLRIALKFAMECLCRTCDEVLEEVSEIDPMDTYTRPITMGSIRNQSSFTNNQI